MEKNNTFTPVDPDFYEIIDQFKYITVRVVYFGEDQSLEESNGKLNGLTKNNQGEFLNIMSDQRVRIDKVITINGKPGPAYDEYDSYANACLSCQAGYDD